jgi:hypothetical protein
VLKGSIWHLAEPIAQDSVVGSDEADDDGDTNLKTVPILLAKTDTLRIKSGTLCVVGKHHISPNEIRHGAR